MLILPGHLVPEVTMLSSDPWSNCCWSLFPKTEDPLHSRSPGVVDETQFGLLFQPGKKRPRLEQPILDQT